MADIPEQSGEANHDDVGVSGDRPWRVELLGWLRARRGQQVVERFRTRKTGVLLAYLAFYSKRSHTREVLVDMLWPDGDPAAGRHSLSQALSSLRNALERFGPDTTTVLLADRHTVALNPSAFTTDVDAFETHHRAARRATSDIARVDHLGRAVDTYGGELLPGCHENWIVGERERLAEAYVQALIELSTYREEIGDLDVALDCALRAVAADPLREEALCELMRLYVAMGQPAAALRQYHRFAGRLQRELGVSPDEATMALARDIAGQSSVPPVERVVPPADHAAATAAPLPGGAIAFLMLSRPDPMVLEGSSDQPIRSHEAGHAAQLRQLARAHDGSVLDAANGARTVAFARPSDALACAVAYSRALAELVSRNHSAGDAIRMALDVVETEPAAEGYPLAALERATRLLGAAHEGQILCSTAAAALMRRDLEVGHKFVDLGLYRLNAEETPERLFQLDHPSSIRPDFPPPRAEPAHSGRLPLQLTRFFGREDEVSQLEALFAQRVRLVTLSGAGGTGKTRLAIALAERLQQPLRGAVWFVPLAEVTDARLIPEAILSAMRVTARTTSEPIDLAAEVLSPRPGLLVMDNFEQLVPEGASTIRALLERVPDLMCLVTSRRPVGVSGEREVRVLPLPTPARPGIAEGLSRFASVRLFVDRARAVNPDFRLKDANAPAVAELCDRLEGIPLALELAAARAQVLTPTQILKRLNRRFDLLVSRKRDVPARHRTLRAAIEWSTRLLSPDLRRIFASLSVFRGGFSLEAVETVCDAPLALDHLAQLCECSLLLSEGQGAELRFRMLETLREYAEEQLPSADRAALQRHHGTFYLDLAEAAAAELKGPGQGVWLDRLAAEHDNLRAGLAWLASQAPQAGLRLAASLARFWWMRGHLAEGRHWITTLLARSSERTSGRADALDCAGLLAMAQGDPEAARRMVEQSLAIRRDLGHRQAVGRSVSALGILAGYQSDYSAAETLFEEGKVIFEELGDRAGLATSHLNLAVVYRHRGDYATARSSLSSALALFQECGDERGMARCFSAMGSEALGRADLESAGRHYDKSLALSRKLGDQLTTAMQLLGLGRIELERGNEASAQSIFDESLSLARETGDRRAIAEALEAQGVLAAQKKQHDRARALYEESLGLFRQMGVNVAAAQCLCSLGRLAHHQGEVTRARSLFRRSVTIARERGERPLVAELVELMAGLEATEANAQRSAVLFGAAAALREALGAPALPTHQHQCDQHLTTLGAALGAAELERALKTGRALAWRDAVELMLVDA